MIKRIFGGVIVLGFLFASTAQAASLDDILKKLTVLQNEISSLKSQLGASTYSSFGSISVDGASSSDAFSTSVVATPSITSTTPVYTNTVPNPNLMNSLSDSLKVTSANRQPSLTVISPNGGETYTAGDKVSIKWKTENYPSSTVNIFLAVPTNNSYGRDQALVLGTKNDGVEIVTLPTSQSWPSSYRPSKMPFGNQYQILIDNNGDGQPLNQAGHIWDLSNGQFSIIESSLPSEDSITLLSPNNGGSFQIGKTMSIKWKTSGIPSTHDVYIQILNQDTNPTSRAVVLLGSNDGNGVITIPTTTDPNSGNDALVPGTYKLRITTLSPDKKYDIQDEADKLITLTGASTSPVAGIVGCDAAKAKGYAIGVTALLIPPQTVPSNSKNVLIGKYKIENCPGIPYGASLISSSMNLVKKDAKGELINLPSNPLSSMYVSLTGKDENNKQLVKFSKPKMYIGGGYNGTAKYIVVESDFTGADLKDLMPISDGGVIMDIYASMKNVNQNNLSLELNNMVHSRPSYYQGNSSYSSGPFSISVKTTSTVNTKTHQ
ncbi:MAG: hypothetical protein WC059_01140 [Candidatus Paceibacterota bacterium]